MSQHELSTPYRNYLGSQFSLAGIQEAKKCLFSTGVPEEVQAEFITNKLLYANASTEYQEYLESHPGIFPIKKIVQIILGNASHFGIEYIPDDLNSKLTFWTSRNKNDLLFEWRDIGRSVLDVPDPSGPSTIFVPSKNKLPITRIEISPYNIRHSMVHLEPPATETLL